MAEEYDEKFKSLNEEQKTYSSNRKDEINFKDKPALLKEYQIKSSLGVLGVFTPGTGAKAAAVACILMLSTF